MNDPQNKNSHLLLVEDEESLAVGMEYNLSAEGYIIDIAADGKQAIAKFEQKTYDLVILDIMLPYMDGFEVARHIRKLEPQIPILMLTARSGVQDRVKGLEIGADDYMSKPFHLNELLLRINGMLRRKAWYQQTVKVQPTLVIGNYEINFDNLVCISSKNQIQLTPHEAMLLKYLVEHKNVIVTRQELLQHVWQIDKPVETRTVDIFIARLRKYFETNPKQPQIFKSVRSAGYMYCDET